MNSIAVAVLACLLVASATMDPIDKLVAQLSANHLWQNGPFPIIDLPEKAETKDVVAAVLKMTGIPDDHHEPWSYKIAEIRQVHITGSLPDLYTAVLLDTNYGKQIVLLQYDHTSWWNRVVRVD